MHVRPRDFTLNYPAGRLEVGDGWGRDRRTSQRLGDHELWFVWKGRGWMADEHERFDLTPGVCVWMRPGGIYDAGVTPGRTLGFAFVHFRWRPSLTPPQRFDVRDVAFMDSAMRRIVGMIGAGPHARPHGHVVPDPPPAAVALLGAVLTGLLTEPPGPGRPLSPHHRRIETIAAELQHQPADAPSVQDLARRCGMTAEHFSRLFREQTGLSPQQYRIRARLERAKALLAESTLSVGQIADALGYHDGFAFSRQFKRHIGVSPTAYRGR